LTGHRQWCAQTARGQAEASIAGRSTFATLAGGGAIQRRLADIANRSTVLVVAQQVSARHRLVVGNESSGARPSTFATAACRNTVVHGGRADCTKCATVIEVFTDIDTGLGSGRLDQRSHTSEATGAVHADRVRHQSCSCRSANGRVGRGRAVRGADAKTDIATVLKCALLTKSAAIRNVARSGNAAQAISALAEASSACPRANTCVTSGERVCRTGASLIGSATCLDAGEDVDAGILVRPTEAGLADILALPVVAGRLSTSRGRANVANRSTVQEAGQQIHASCLVSRNTVELIA